MQYFHEGITLSWIFGNYWLQKNSILHLTFFISVWLLKENIARPQHKQDVKVKLIWNKLITISLFKLAKIVNKDEQHWELILNLKSCFANTTTRKGLATSQSGKKSKFVVEACNNPKSYNMKTTQPITFANNLLMKGSNMRKITRPQWMKLCKILFLLI